MNQNISIKLFEAFESIKHSNEGIEFWSARDLQTFLGYTKWENFVKVIEKAKSACKASGNTVSDHFPDIRKSIISGKWASFEIEDIMLSRYACYLAAQNGDSTKPEIAFAQTYFAVQTRKWELIQERLGEQERINARQKQSLTEKQFHKIAFERGVDSKGIARIISKGDKTLFGWNSTAKMKEKLAVADGRALADFLPTVTIKAKDLATEMTNFNMGQHDLQWESSITKEHMTNNHEVRNMLRKRGITPEELPAEEDIKKIERKLSSEVKKSFGLKKST